MTINYEKTFQGAWVLSASVGGYYERRQFMGYTKKEIADTIRDFPDFHDGCEENEDCENDNCAISNLPDSALFEIWQFRPHRATPSQFERFGYKPSDIESDWNDESEVA